MSKQSNDVEKQLQTTDSGATASESYWFLMSPKEVAHKLDTSIDEGLRDGPVKERQQRDGPNELSGGGGVSVWSILAGQVFSESLLIILLRLPPRFSLALR
jgi:magnesium-transporting ATPase (P-type)